MGHGALTEILEIAAEEFGIERDDHSESKNRRKEAMDSERVKSACEHSCGDHTKLMNPGLWETLPRELLQLVFARLPVDEIGSLQFLNTDWQKTILADSEFHRACNEVHRKMVCLITGANNYDFFWARMISTVVSGTLTKVFPVMLLLT